MQRIIWLGGWLELNKELGLINVILPHTLLPPKSSASKIFPSFLDQILKGLQILWGAASWALKVALEFHLEDLTLTVVLTAMQALFDHVFCHHICAYTLRIILCQWNVLLAC